MTQALREKPRQNFAGLWNISFGFFGIQIGFALQNSNMSRVFQTLGSSIDDLPALWVAAPLTGLLVQPIIGHLSDRTWNRLGRRTNPRRNFGYTNRPAKQNGSAKKSLARNAKNEHTR